MSSQNSNKTNLRDRQQLATREEIIDMAMKLHSSGVEVVSHELIASESGMSSRTVYRHFPDRTSLMSAIWLRLREIANIRFPSKEQEIVPLSREAFASLDEHAPLVKAVMASVAGAQLQRLPAEEASNAFTKSLGSLLDGLTSSERRKIVAPFTAIYSAPFWQLLRERGGLSGKEAQESTAWVLEALLNTLHSKAIQSNRKKKNK